MGFDLISLIGWSIIGQDNAAAFIVFHWRREKAKTVFFIVRMKRFFFFISLQSVWSFVRDNLVLLLFMLTWQKLSSDLSLLFSHTLSLHRSFATHVRVHTHTHAFTHKYAFTHKHAFAPILHQTANIESSQKRAWTFYVYCLSLILGSTSSKRLPQQGKTNLLYSILPVGLL